MDALRPIADGVLVHVSEFLQSNAVVVQGGSGVLLVDPGVTSGELEAIADDLERRGLPVVAGFSTHPDWDHLLWHERFGDVPRYGTARCAASIRAVLAQPDWEAQIAEGLPPEHADEIPMALLGGITGLPDGTVRIPWDGPDIRILEHRAHATGHAALLVEDRGVLVAGDMLSDTLMPFLDLEAADPLGDYLAALRLLDSIADDVQVVVPGHGSVGGAAQLRMRIDQDRAYVQRLQRGEPIDDARVGQAAPLEWLPDVHRSQVQRLAERELTAAP
jgi:glyoxylase-like metal-dependent hydrolase (beta-lactamase superfamily II)